MPSSSLSAAMVRAAVLAALFVQTTRAMPAALIAPGGSCSSDDDCGSARERGLCLARVCACAPAWHGPDCSWSRCPRGCTGHGSCSFGICTCSDGWAGPACDVPNLPCPNSCSGHGHGCIDGGPCLCDAGYVGTSCERQACANDCHHHGRCQPDGTCICDEGFGGETCEQPVSL